MIHGKKNKQPRAAQALGASLVKEENCEGDQNQTGRRTAPNLR